MNRIKRIITNGGPLKADYQDLNDFINEIDTLTEIQKTELIELISPVLCLDTMQGHAFHKPHGYSGDYEIIDKIYLHWMSDNPNLIKWDEFFHSQEAPIAVRNRKKYFINLLAKIEQSSNRAIEQSSNRAIEQSLRVLNIGSGPARDIKEYFDLNTSSIANIDCVELDEKAITHATEVCKQYINRITAVPLTFIAKPSD